MSERPHVPDVVSDLAAHARDVLFRYGLTPPLGFVYVSPSVHDLLGYTPEDLYADAQMFVRLAHPDDRDGLGAVFQAPDGVDAPLVVRFVHQQGEVVWAELNLVGIRDADSGTLTWLDGIARNVTRREQNALRLEMVQARARSGTPDPRPPVRVLIVDDHQLTRAGLTATLARNADLVVVGEAATGRGGVELTRLLQPDLVLMDVRMPVMDGLEATRRLKQECPMTSVLLLSMFDEPDLLVAAIEAGAAGYVLKEASLDALQQAISEVLSGGFPVDDRLAREALLKLARAVPAPQRPTSTLSPRELEVLRLLARGSTNREIAEVLVITPHTVKVHVEHILAKLGVSDRTQAAVRAIELGLLRPSD